MAMNLVPEQVPTDFTIAARYALSDELASGIISSKICRQHVRAHWRKSAVHAHSSLVARKQTFYLLAETGLRLCSLVFCNDRQERKYWSSGRNSMMTFSASPFVNASTSGSRQRIKSSALINICKDKSPLLFNN